MQLLAVQPPYNDKNLPTPNPPNPLSQHESFSLYGQRDIMLE